MKKTITLKEVKRLEAAYASALTTCGPSNMVTQRAEIAWYEAKEKWTKRKLEIDAAIEAALAKEPFQHPLYA